MVTVLARDRARPRCAGALAGLFGVGGGILFVPTLVRCSASARSTRRRRRCSRSCRPWPRAAWRQHRYGNVRWRAALVVGLAAVAGVELGVLTAQVAARRHAAAALRRALARRRRAARLAARRPFTLKMVTRQEDLWLSARRRADRRDRRARSRPRSRSCEPWSQRPRSCSRSGRSPTSGSGSLLGRAPDRGRGRRLRRLGDAGSRRSCAIRASRGDRGGGPRRRRGDAPRRTARSPGPDEAARDASRSSRAASSASYAALASVATQKIATNPAAVSATRSAGRVLVRLRQQVGRAHEEEEARVEREQVAERVLGDGDRRPDDRADQRRDRVHSRARSSPAAGRRSG